MKKLRNILMVLFTLPSFLSFGQATKKDTTFLLKENENGTYHAIFIDTNKKSEFYDQISDFSFGEFDQTSYANSLEFFKKHKLNLTYFSAEDLPKKWIKLEQYKGRFYAYKPSDFYTHFKIGLTDTTLINYTGEGPIANKVVAFKKIDDKTYNIKMTGLYDTNRTLTVHIIDTKNGLAIFEDSSNGLEAKYNLMISASKIRNLPLIVNYCETQKQKEFKFDQPNFDQLLKTQ